MEDFENEKWVELYRGALLELERSLIAGRIVEARTEITARVEKLRKMPGLHREEQAAIDDALRGLRSLERESQQAFSLREGGRALRRLR